MFDQGIYVGRGGGSSGGQGITDVVANYSALPSAAAAADEFYFVESPQGTAWLPGSLGGTYYPAGLYYSNGVTWFYAESPYQAKQATVNAGINTDQFVSPATLAAATTVERPLTFSTGLTRTGNTIKSNISIAYLTNTLSSTTGDTNENILYSSDNLTGLFSINSVVRFLIQYAGTSSANTKTIKLYVGTSSNSLTGATQLATYNFTTNTALQKGLVRNMRILSALTSNEIIASVTNGLDNDETALSSNASITSIGFDFGGSSIYFHITGQNSNSGETITLRHSRAELIK